MGPRLQIFYTSRIDHFKTNLVNPHKSYFRTPTFGIRNVFGLAVVCVEDGAA